MAFYRSLLFVLSVSVATYAYPVATQAITIGVYPVAPYVMSRIDPLSGTREYYGMMYDLFENVLAVLNSNPNATAILVPNYVEFSESGSLNATTNQWSGIVGAVSRNEVALALGPVTMLGSRSSYVQFTPWLPSPYALLVQKPQLQTAQWSFVEPFSSSMWASLLGTTIMFALGLCVTDRFSPFGHRHAELDLQLSRQLNVPQSIFQSFVYAVGKGSTEGRAWSTRIIVFAMSFFSLLLLSHYTATLTTLQTLRAAPPRVASLDDVINTKTPVCVVDQSSVYTWVLKNTDKRIQSMSDFWVLMPSADACVAALRKQQISAVLNSQMTLRWYIQQPPCDSMVVGTLEAQGFMGFAVPHGSPIATQLQSAVLDQVSGGVVSQLAHQYVPDGGCAAVDTSDASLKAADMGGAFIVLGVMMVGALVMLVLEKIVYMNRFKTAKYKIWRRLNICCGLHYDPVRKEDPFRAKRLMRSSHSLLTEEGSVKDNPLNATTGDTNGNGNGNAGDVLEAWNPKTKPGNARRWSIVHKWMVSRKPMSSVSS